MEVKIGISKQLEEHQVSLQQYLTRMAKQTEGTKRALSEEHVIQLLEEHYQRLQEQLQQMRPNTQETIEEENRSFIRSLVDYFVSILEKANRAIEWTASECEGLQKRWTTSVLEGSQTINRSLMQMTEKVADKLDVEKTNALEKEMLEAIVDTEEPEESVVKENQQEIKPDEGKHDQPVTVNQKNSVHPENLETKADSSIPKPIKEPTPSKETNISQPPTEQTPPVKPEQVDAMAITDVFGEAPPEDPYEQVLTEVYLSEQTAPANINPVVQEVQENTKETLQEVQEVITQKAEEEEVVLTPEKLTEILQEREANLLQVVQNMLDNQPKVMMKEALQQEKTSTVTKIKEAYQDVKHVVKANTVDKVLQTKNHVALTLRKGVLHINQKLYQLSVQLDEKLQEKLVNVEIESPSLLEAHPDMKEAGFNLTVGEEPYLIRYSDAENHLVVTSKNNPMQKIPYSDTLNMEELTETIQQSKDKTEAPLPEEPSEEVNKGMDL
ncbi:hypothetical protein HB801_12030 [Listeria welshimeri]|nr:hypothetical protein [Listeria welshimeri]